MAITVQAEPVLVELLRAFLAARAPEYGIRLAYLFGSHARGRAGPESDVDAAVLLDTPPTGDQPELSIACYERYRALAANLTQSLASAPVDLHLLRWPAAGDTDGITAAAVHGRLMYAADDAERVVFETAALAAAFDLAERHAVRRRYLAQRIAAGRMGEGARDMIDRRVVEERLDYVDGMLGHLKAYRGLSLDAFKADARTSHAALFELQTALEAVADVATHIVAAMGWRRPEGRVDLFRVLAEEGVLPEDLAQRLGLAMAMRNAIVHGYLRIALDLVHYAIHHEVGDLEAFARHVLRFLDEQGRAHDAGSPPAEGD